VQQEQQLVVLDPETAVFHFWSLGGVRHRPQRVASAAVAASADAAATAATATAAAGAAAAAAV